MKIKKGWLIAGIIVITACAIGALSTQVTVHQPYHILRAEADEDTAIDLTTAGAFASKPASAIRLPVTGGGVSTVNAIQIAFIGGDTANDTFNWRLYGWRKDNGPAELIANGTGILGTQAVVTYPQGGTATDKFWADTLVVSAQFWMRTVTVTTVGGNSVGKLMFDFLGYEWIYIEITSADGTSGIEAGDITVYYSYI